MCFIATYPTLEVFNTLGSVLALTDEQAKANGILFTVFCVHLASEAGSCALTYLYYLLGSRAWCI